VIYASVCSGIEAATVAWSPLGWEPAWFAETAAFPSAVLAHRFPGVPNIGDFTKHESIPQGRIDLLVGGTPCQSFSQAGKCGGLADGRGNLALAFTHLAARLRARWVVWENVPGVLSSDRGGSFASILGALARGGYSCAWRVLDAQYFGVPQRRRRVFLVGHLGPYWRHAPAVLFERKGLRRNPQPSEPARGSSIEAPPRSLREDGLAVVNARQNPIESRVAQPLDSYGNSQAVLVEGYLRRFTPRECERLQGFPDDWILVPWRGKPAEQCPNTPRYRVIGNSMAVPVMRWIGERIEMIDNHA